MRTFPEKNGLLDSVTRNNIFWLGNLPFTILLCHTFTYPVNKIELLELARKSLQSNLELLFQGKQRCPNFAANFNQILLLRVLFINVNSSLQFLALFSIAKFNLVRVEQRSNKIFRLKLSVWTIAGEAAVYGEVFLEKALKMWK